MAIAGNKFKNTMSGYQTRTVPPRLEHAFELMRDRGLVTNMGAGCCNGCTQGALADQIHRMDDRSDVKGYAYFTEQNDYANGAVGIGYHDIHEYREDAPSTKQIGEIIADCLDEAGVTYYWEDRSPAKKIFTGDRAYGNSMSGYTANYIVQGVQDILTRMGGEINTYSLRPYLGGTYGLTIKIAADLDLDEFQIRFDERFQFSPEYRERITGDGRTLIRLTFDCVHRRKFDRLHEEAMREFFPT